MQRGTSLPIYIYEYFSFENKNSFSIIRKLLFLKYCEPRISSGPVSEIVSAWKQSSAYNETQTHCQSDGWVSPRWQGHFNLSLILIPPDLSSLMSSLFPLSNICRLFPFFSVQSYSSTWIREIFITLSKIDKGIIFEIWHKMDSIFTLCKRYVSLSAIVSLSGSMTFWRWYVLSPDLFVI